MAYCPRCNRTSKLTGKRFICRYCPPKCEGRFGLFERARSIQSFVRVPRVGGLSKNILCGRLVKDGRYRPRDAQGWRVPEPGTLSRKIYDRVIEGTSPQAIAKELRVSKNSVRVLAHRFRHPDLTNMWHATE